MPAGAAPNQLGAPPPSAEGATTESLPLPPACSPPGPAQQPVQQHPPEDEDELHDLLRLDVALVVFADPRRQDAAAAAQQQAQADLAAAVVKQAAMRREVAVEVGKELLGQREVTAEVGKELYGWPSLGRGRPPPPPPHAAPTSRPDRPSKLNKSVLRWQCHNPQLTCAYGSMQWPS